MKGLCGRFEIEEQLSWQTPDHIVAPMDSGAMLHAISKGLEELKRIWAITFMPHDNSGITKSTQN
jgi:threonine synthase